MENKCSLWVYWVAPASLLCNIQELVKYLYRLWICAVEFMMHLSREFWDSGAPHYKCLFCDFILRLETASERWWKFWENSQMLRNFFIENLPLFKVEIQLCNFFLVSRFARSQRPKIIEQAKLNGQCRTGLQVLLNFDSDSRCEGKRGQNEYKHKFQFNGFFTISLRAPKKNAS